MQSRWKILLGLCLASLVAASIWLYSGNDARDKADRTRRELKRQGFKLQLSDFRFDKSSDLRARAAEITAAAEACRSFGRRDMLMLARCVGSNALIPIAQQNFPHPADSPDPWVELRTRLNEQAVMLDRAAIALLSGRIQFEPVPAATGELLFPNLPDMRAFAFALALRTLIELHDNNHLEAWTNLLAVTRLAACWNSGPAELSHLVRILCLVQAQRVTWEALQCGGWNESELANLQTLWEQADFLSHLPETVAFTRANVVFLCEHQRETPVGPGIPLSRIAMEFIDSPARAWSDFTSGSREENYRRKGLYEDETKLLLFLRDQEIRVSSAITASTWKVMSTLPGSTQVAAAPEFNERQLALLTYPPRSTAYPRPSLSGRVAEAESRRRILVTALALERFRLRENHYPDSLASLVPRYASSVPADFIDGQPLRYQRTEDDHFLCYSLGLDGVDQGGQMFEPETNSAVSFPPAWRRREPDLVWPRPATAAESQEELPRIMDRVLEAFGSGPPSRRVNNRRPR